MPLETSSRTGASAVVSRSHGAHLAGDTLGMRKRDTADSVATASFLYGIPCMHPTHLRTWRPTHSGRGNECGRSKSTSEWDPSWCVAPNSAEGSGRRRVPRRQRRGRSRSSAPPSKKQTPQSCPSTDLSSSQKELIISNWQAYIDPFEEERECRRSESSRMRPASMSRTPTTSPTTTSSSPRSSTSSARCETVKRDMFMLTDWMADRDDPARLDPEARPQEPAQRRRRTCCPTSRTSPFDPGRQYSVPWQSGFTGIAYNADLVPEVRNFDELLTRDDLKGRSRCSPRCATRWASCSRTSAPTRPKFTDAQWDEAIHAAHRRTRSRPDPGVHRQRVHPRPRRREHRGLRGVVG